MNCCQAPESSAPVASWRLLTLPDANRRWRSKRGVIVAGMNGRGLYFLLNPALGIIKIGIARNVGKRRIALEQACGVPLVVLRVVPGGALFEKDLHNAFAPQRLRGEWFAPSEALLELANGTEPIHMFLMRGGAR